MSIDIMHDPQLIGETLAAIDSMAPHWHVQRCNNGDYLVTVRARWPQVFRRQNLLAALTLAQVWLQQQEDKR